MCCLRYEYEAYKDFKSRAPKRGAKVETPTGEGKVTGHNTPRETVQIRLAEGGSITVPIDSVECPGGGCPCRISAEAMEALVGPAASSVLTGPVRELGESKPDSGNAPERRESGESGESGGSGGGKRRSRRKGKSKQQPDSGQQQAAASSEGAGGDAKGGADRSGEQPAAGGAPEGRRRRRRRSSPKKDDNAQG